LDGEIMFLSGLLVWIEEVTQRASKWVVHCTMIALLDFLGTHGIGALPFPKSLFCGRLIQTRFVFFIGSIRFTYTAFNRNLASRLFY
jgi:hypothetical protein